MDATQATAKPAPPAGPAPQSSKAAGPTRWEAPELADPHRVPDKATRVEAMFDAIAPTYERVNSVASLGQDARWRRKAVQLAQVGPRDAVADICCGTGDMLRTFAALAAPPRVLIGLDFSAKMLANGQYPVGLPPIQLLRADGLRLPLQSEQFDALTCAFGVRNFQDLSAGLREMHRVLRRGGRAVILEFALPENAILRGGYRLYTEWVLPRLGAWISGDRSGAYRYLPESIRTFERRGEMLARLREAGFTSVEAHPMNLGGVVAYRAVK